MTLNDVDATNDNAMFNWLYEEGQTSVARAVLGAENDDKLWEQFRNIYTGM